MADGPARLEDYALLGDCRSAALVSREGSVDWWCVPRFDSGACFAALLGTPDNGRFLIAPAAESQSSRRYLSETMVLETEHDTPTGRVRVVDCLLVGRDRPVLVRMVEGLSGEVDMRLELVVRFDYGSIVPWVRSDDGVWTAVGGPDGLELRTPVEVRGEDLKTVAEFTVKRRQRVTFVLAWFPSHERDVRAAPRARARDEDHQVLAGMVGAVRLQRPLARARVALPAHARVAHLHALRAASSPRPPPRCPRRSAVPATGTTATAGYATRRSRSRR